MYSFLRSKRGYTLFEVAIVLIVLSILTAVAVPVYKGVSNKQKIKDCKNQIVVIKGYVDMVMSGMEDNGVKIVNMTVSGTAAHGSGASAYWVVSLTESPSIGQMRVGQTQAELTAGTAATDHLKKASKDDVPFKSLLTELPGCPLDVDSKGDEAKALGYRIYSDGHVACNNPKCPNCPNYTG